MTSSLDRPLFDRDIAALDELLAGIDAERDPLDVAMLDGFLVGVLLQPDVVLPSAWLPLVFDGEGREAALPDLPTAQRTIALVMRRYNELAACIVAREPFDPIVFEAVDDTGTALAGKAGIVALAPWAIGFAESLEAFPALAAAAADDDGFASLLASILRHLPVGPDADDARAQAEFDRELPLADLDEAIDELVATVLDIADITRPNRPLTRASPKVGRNDPCPCGSGRKYKACHGR